MLRNSSTQKLGTGDSGGEGEYPTMGVKESIQQALPMALIISCGGYYAGILEKTTALVIFIFMIFRAVSSPGGSAETEGLVGKKAPDFEVTDPISGKKGSLLKDYVSLARPIVLDFYQSF